MLGDAHILSLGDLLVTLEERVTERNYNIETS